MHDLPNHRIRDKVAPSRRKGMWMGGWTPLGYEVCDRKLIIHASDSGEPGRANLGETAMLRV